MFFKLKTINSKTNYRNKPTLNRIFAFVNMAQKYNSKKGRQLPFQGGYKAAFELRKNKNEEQTKKPQNFFL